MSIPRFVCLQPTPELRTLILLSALLENSKLSQKDLAQKAGLAASMVNSYLKDFETKGWLKRYGNNHKNMHYYITKPGKEKHNRLLANYLTDLFSIYQVSKTQFLPGLLDLQKQGITHLGICGLHIMAEVVASVAEDIGFPRVGLLVTDKGFPGKHHFRSLSEMVEFQPQVILLAFQPVGSEEECYWQEKLRLQNIPVINIWNNAKTELPLNT